MFHYVLTNSNMYGWLVTKIYDRLGNTYKYGVTTTTTTLYDRVDDTNKYKFGVTTTTTTLYDMIMRTNIWCHNNNNNNNNNNWKNTKHVFFHFDI